MNNSEIPSLWGVKGLNEAEQRAVRGGALPGGRAQCIRQAISNYVSNRRNNNDSRSNLLNNLRNEISNCVNGSN